MRIPPEYFEPIRQGAAQRWVQLEQDPELAAPWHQLFNQVQNPRYVVSELLQNADDAGATEISVSIEDGSFVFTHNGEDFTKEQFASLCGFGFSNKRTLHTIGFRGIGFKSTFSLGDTVEICTPTLSVAFDKQRFTEPRWLPGTASDAPCTTIRVKMSEEHRDLQKNLQEWLQSPASLLFFNHIRLMRIGNQQVRWTRLKPGPAPDSEWMALNDHPTERFLVARSDAEAFPPNAIAEIRETRSISADQDADLPPCRVEIVLGQKGRLYAVLPTGVETPLPFACNAPFIQDPARLRVKDPENSPTNRWLLKRIGTLAASVMLAWLEQGSATIYDRSDAYGLFPEVKLDDSSLPGVCAAAVANAFGDSISGKPFLLTNDGGLQPASGAVILPPGLCDVWPAEQIAVLFDTLKRPPFSWAVPFQERQKLIRLGVVEEISNAQVVDVLRSGPVPVPSLWSDLLKLWLFVAPEVTGYRSYTSRRDSLHIVPVQGKDVLLAASETVRLSDRRLLQSDADWEFLSEHLLVVNQGWTRFLTEQRRDAEEHANVSLSDDIDAANALLRAIGLEDTSQVSKVLDQAAVRFFAGRQVTRAECVRLAQIAAALGASVGDAFRFATRNLKLKAPNDIVLYDKDGTLPDLFPNAWCDQHLLHPNYTAYFASCTAEEWERWVSSGNARLLTFAPLMRRDNSGWHKREDFEGELRRRGFTGTVEYHYRSTNYAIRDWNFEDSLRTFWGALSKEDEYLWQKLLERLLAQPATVWSKSTSADAVQIASQGSTRVIASSFMPEWILRLRNLRCLPDTRGFIHVPHELLRRTPETESLIDVESFVDGRLDTEANRPLLKLLGVRDAPMGPGHLLDRVRALARTTEPPVSEVEKWYSRLDLMASSCSTADLASIKDAFRTERLILLDGGGWSGSRDVFLSSDDDVPDTPVVRRTVASLTLWRKVGVAERPTAAMAMQWLQELPSGKVLPADELKRVRALLTRHAERAWDECSHWLNLSGGWVPTETFRYAITARSPVAWSHLHEGVKQATADLSHIREEISDAPPFSSLPSLASQIEDRLQHDATTPRHEEQRLWLNQVGHMLCRITMDDDAETACLREIAGRLAETTWVSTREIAVVPYIRGVPAGTPKRTEVAWFETTLYVDDLPNARLANLVPERLGRAFNRADITAALNYCFGRSPAEISEYLAENFTLAPVPESAVRGAEADGFEELPFTSPPATFWQSASPAASTDAEASGEAGLDTLDWTDEGDEDGWTEQGGLDDLDGGQPYSQRSQSGLRPRKVNIVERFAAGQGFRKDGDGRFTGANGETLLKVSGEIFPWERHNAAGETVRRYWGKELCLEREPLQLSAEIWGMTQQFPDICALVLVDREGKPVEITGTTLNAMQQGRTLTLYPAAYRLVHDDDARER